MRKIDLVSDENFIKIVNSCSTLSEVMNNVGYSKNNYNASIYIKNRMSSLNININYDNKYDHLKKPEKEVYTNPSKLSSSSISSRVKKDNFMEYKCISCGNLGVWNDKLLTLQLHHIDGNFRNNEKNNIVWMCPNCHSQTDNYGSKNKFRSNNPRKKFLNYINCPMCKKDFLPKYRGQKYCSSMCSNKSKVSIVPIEKEKLYKLLCKYTFTKVAHDYNVSDNTIRKWCVKLEIPNKSSYYRDL